MTRYRLTVTDFEESTVELGRYLSPEAAWEAAQRDFDLMHDALSLPRETLHRSEDGVFGHAGDEYRVEPCDPEEAP